MKLVTFSSEFIAKPVMSIQGNIQESIYHSAFSM